MQSSNDIPLKLRLRLMVALPVGTSLFVLVLGVLVYHFLGWELAGLDTHSGVISKPIVGWILLMTFLCLAGSFMATYILTGHLRALIRKGGGLIQQVSNEVRAINAASEIEALGIILDEATVTLGTFIRDGCVAENLSEAVLSISQTGRVTAANRKAASLLGLSSPLEARGMALRDLIPEDAFSESFYGRLDGCMKGSSFPLHPVNLVLGGINRTYWIGMNPISGVDGTIEAVAILFRDQADVQAIRSQIQRIERLAALGFVFAGIAHEVRNPLGTIRAFTELIEEDFSPSDPKRSYTQEIASQVEHLNNLVEDVLAFSREPVFAVDRLDIRELLTQAVSMARYKCCDKNIQVDESYPKVLPLITGDPERLLQAFLNILINAFDACPENGLVRVSVTCEPLAAPGCGTVRVSIADNGEGISRENLGKIFEPLFTTKPQGTGLGLSLTYRLITAHGGSIDVISEPDRGANFVVNLPEKGYAGRDRTGGGV